MASHFQPINDGLAEKGRHPRDPTFRSYTATQAAAYARSRRGYSDALYDYVIKYHKDTGGHTGLVVDVGCGPGNATRDLAAYFDHAVGCDPGEAMIQEAKLPGYKTRISEKIHFEAWPAEDLDQLKVLQPGSVDMITCAMSAHWFHLEKFYPVAARLLKSGGTLAMWTCGSYYVHPETQNAELVQQQFTHLEKVVLAPYAARGNMQSYDVYDDLELPWSYDPPLCSDEFKEDCFHRKVWNRDGKVTQGFGGGFLEGNRQGTLADAQLALGTSSMVTRWREANKGKLESGEIKDCVEETFEKARAAMGVEKEDDRQTIVRTGMATGLVMMKRVRSNDTNEPV